MSAFHGTPPESRSSAAVVSVAMVTVTAPVAPADAASALGTFLEVLHP